MDKTDKMEILAAIGQLGGMIGELDRKVGELDKKVGELDKKVDELARDAKATASRLDRLDGQFSVVVTWMQSMDQRFTALMHPYEPRKPAAG